MTKNALLERGPKNSGMGRPPPLFRQCPKESGFFKWRPSLNQTRKPYSQGYLEYSQEYLCRIFLIGRPILPLVFKSVCSAAIYPSYYFQIGPRSDRWKPLKLIKIQQFISPLVFDCSQKFCKLSYSFTSFPIMTMSTTQLLNFDICELTYLLKYCWHRLVFKFTFYVDATVQQIMQEAAAFGKNIWI